MKHILIKNYQYVYNKLKRRITNITILSGTPTVLIVECSWLFIPYTVACEVSETLTQDEINKLAYRLVF